jgi:hypothetical protein
LLPCNLRLNLCGASEIHRKKNNETLEKLENDFSIIFENFKTMEQEIKETEFILLNGDFESAYKRLNKSSKKINFQEGNLDQNSTIIYNKNEIIRMTYLLFDEKKNDLIVMRNELNEIEKKQR